MILKYKIHCNSENADKVWFLPDTDTPPNTCPTNTDHSVDLNSVTVIQIGGPQDVVQVLGPDSLTLFPFGDTWTAPHNETSIQDIPLPLTMTLRGGCFFSPNAAMGDYISLQIVDKDNVLGMGASPGNPLIVAEYIMKWCVMPGVPNEIEDVSISQALPQGLYIRVNYTSTSPSVDPQIVMNFLSYVSNQ